MAAVLPDWMRDLPDHTLITTKEVAEVFGMHRCSIWKAIRTGTVPPPAQMHKEGWGIYGAHQRMRWALGDVRKFIRAA